MSYSFLSKFSLKDDQKTMLYFKTKIGWDFYDLNKVNQNKKQKKTKPRRFVVGYVHGACYSALYNVISLRTCNCRKAGHAKRDLKHSCFDLCIPEAVLKYWN